tara:strand:- start:997 stop:1719 length:723 start_codon:yes stop_codon:yes gene_type:complete
MKIFCSIIEKGINKFKVSRFLTTIPSNLGFFNLGTVESYPTGGGGPTAYGPTSYFGSDPLPAQLGDNLNNPIDLGDFSAIFKTKVISDTHGGTTRKQSTFYQFKLNQPRTVQFTQLFSRTSYEENTNRNTLIAFYEIDENNHRQELPINNDGYVYKESSIDYLDDENILPLSDYPNTRLNSGKYLFVITNDIRYIKTTFSIGLNVSVLDWRFITESIDEQINLGSVNETVSSTVNFGQLS